MVILYYIFRLFPIQKNKIFIQNFNGKGYGDNPKYIVEEILQRRLNYVIVWAVRPGFLHDFPTVVKTVPYKSIRAIYEEATAKIWIDNCRKQLYVRKRKEQYYIQTWHGTACVKKIEKDAEQKLSDYYVRQAKYDSSLINLFLSASKFYSQLYRSAFWYNGDIFECGSPRADILINPARNIKDKVQNFFNINSNTRIILYAPTFRNNFAIDIYKINYEQILNSLREKTKETWIFLLRLHPGISEKSDFFVYAKTVLNASNYSDMQELLLASDILITDYSGCMSDFSLMKKPVFLYINDYEEYKKEERALYFDLFSLPFPCAVTTSELIENIIHFDNEKYLSSLNEYFQKVGIFRDGNASEKIVNRLITEIFAVNEKRIGYTAGVYDLFHIGHLNILRKAKEQCEYLIVAVSTDELVSYKGKRAVIPFKERIQIVGAIRYVDKVVSQENMDKLAAWKKYQFDVMFVGDDWKGTEKWNNIEIELKKYNVDIVYFPYTKETSSTLIKETLINLQKTAVKQEINNADYR